MNMFGFLQFLGVWHVIQGTRIGNRLECMTFNLTRDSDAGIKMTQLPLNESSRLVMNDKKPSMMRIQLSDLVEAGFSVLVTDYGESRHMVLWSVEKLFKTFYCLFSDNFAGFFICRNEFGEKFLRAAAVLSRTHTLSDDQHNLVKDRLRDHGISDDDLTVVISCNWH